MPYTLQDLQALADEFFKIGEKYNFAKYYMHQVSSRSPESEVNLYWHKYIGKAGDKYQFKSDKGHLSSYSVVQVMDFFMFNGKPLKEAEEDIKKMEEQKAIRDAKARARREAKKKAERKAANEKKYACWYAYRRKRLATDPEYAERTRIQHRENYLKRKRNKAESIGVNVPANSNKIFWQKVNRVYADKEKGIIASREEMEALFGELYKRS